MHTLITCLEQDHDLIRTLMNYINSPENSLAHKKRHFEKFAEVLLNHLRSEEETVYSSSKVLKNPRLHQLIHDGLQQHYLIKNSIAKIRSSAKENSWIKDFKFLSELIEFHLDEEESEYFQELKRSFSKEQLDAVTEQYNKLNESLRQPVVSKHIIELHV